jgi:glycine cleavage system regulatory protein
MWAMNVSIILTILASDRPGIVRGLSEIVAKHEASWLESKMARMAGQFAGILRVECTRETAEPLLADLKGLEREGIFIQTQLDGSPAPQARKIVKLDVVGNDRPGIVHALATAVTGVGANVEELETTLESAPMSGHPIFHACGLVSLTSAEDVEKVVAAIEQLGPDLSVEIDAE